MMPVVTVSLLINGRIDNVLPGQHQANNAAQQGTEATWKAAQETPISDPSCTFIQPFSRDSHAIGSRADKALQAAASLALRSSSPVAGSTSTTGMHATTLPFKTPM
jgi:hypothetical protein